VPQAERRRVQAWLGSHLIADWIGNAPHAERLAASMRAQFSSLRITNESLVGGRGQAGASSDRTSALGDPR
jgi:hypothetical protein